MKRIDIGQTIFYTVIVCVFLIGVGAGGFLLHGGVKAYRYIEETHRVVCDQNLALNGNRALIEAQNLQIQHLTDRATALALEYDRLQKVIHEEWVGIVNTRETVETLPWGPQRKLREPLKR